MSGDNKFARPVNLHMIKMVKKQVALLQLVIYRKHGKVN